MKRVLALLLVAAMVLSGCAVPSSEGAGEAPSELATFSGEELYTGIFFGDGPAGGLVPSIQSYVDESLALTPERRRHVDTVVAEIRTASPEFFGQFARDIQSGDHLVIRDALQRAAELTAETAQRMRKATEQEVGANMAPIDPAVDIEVFVYAVAVVFIFVIDFTPVQGAPQEGLVLDSLTDDLAALGGR